MITDQKNFKYLLISHYGPEAVALSCYVKKYFLKNLHLFLITLLAEAYKFIKKRDSHESVFMRILRNFKENLFLEEPPVLPLYVPPLPVMIVPLLPSLPLIIVSFHLLLILNL